MTGDRYSDRVSSLRKNTLFYIEFLSCHFRLFSSITSFCCCCVLQVYNRAFCVFVVVVVLLFSFSLFHSKLKLSIDFRDGGEKI